MPHLGADVQVALGLSIKYLGRFGLGARAHGRPFDLSPLGAIALVQLPGLERSFTAVTGTLEVEGADPSSWRIASVAPLTVLGSRKEYVRDSLDRAFDNGEGVVCEALGTLSICGKEIASPSRQFVDARVHRFQSFCLKGDDPRFGTWYDVLRYRDLGSDPDVIAASVCLAELELVLS